MNGIAVEKAKLISDICYFLICLFFCSNFNASGNKKMYVLPYWAAMTWMRIKSYWNDRKQTYSKCQEKAPITARLSSPKQQQPQSFMSRTQSSSCLVVYRGKEQDKHFEAFFVTILKMFPRNLPTMRLRSLKQYWSLVTFSL